MITKRIIKSVVSFVFKMDHDAWADVFHDIGIAVLTVGAAAGYSGDIVDSVFGIVGGFALIRIAHSIRKEKKED